jgi:Nif-specific regulatory protein
MLDECWPGCPGVETNAASPLLEAAAPGGCRVADEFSLLFDISYTLESSIELREVIRPVLLKMSEVLGMKRGAITILNREQGTASISEAVGLPTGQNQQDYLLACRELIQQVMESGLAMVVPDIAKEPALQARCQQEPTATPDAPSAAYICVPIKFGTEVIGALSVERILEGHVQLSADRRLLSLIANVIAHTVHFHRLTQEKLQLLQRENERLQHQIETSFRPANMIGNS